MKPILLLEDGFYAFTPGMDKKEYESYDFREMKITFIEVLLKPRSWWFIKLETQDTTYYLWIDKKHFEQLRKLAKKGENEKKMLLQKLKCAIFCRSLC